MFKKFLTLIGLASVQLEDGKAKFELTEEQMEASGKIIDEKETAEASAKRLAAELEEERQQNTTAQADLITSKEEIATLTADVERLKGLSGAAPLEPIIETDGKQELSAHVVDDKLSWMQNYQNVGAAWGFLQN